MQRIVITGGAGFIGSNLADYLAHRGDEIIVLDNFSTGTKRNLDHLSDHIEIIEEDIRSIDALREAFDGADHVLHHAALSSVSGSLEDPLETDMINVHGTLNVLVAARDAGVSRVVFASSASVYGNTGSRVNAESDPVHPTSPYAVSKVAGEHYCRVFTETYGLETVILRYFNVFGPRQDPESEYAAVIPKFVHTLIADRPVTIFGDGHQTRDFVYVGDIVRANALALYAPAEEVAGEIFNIATGVETSVAELADVLGRMLHTDREPKHGPERAGEVRFSRADISKARTHLGYEPEYGIRDGLGALLRTIY